MATYNGGYFHTQVRRRKQKYSLLERVIDFSKKPVYGTTGNLEKTWADSDVLEVFGVRAGQWVLGVSCEIIEQGTNKTGLKVGDGTFPARYGIIEFNQRGSGNGTGWVNDHADTLNSTQPGMVGAESNFGVPVHYATADTIDLTLDGTITKGKIRLVLHILEDDR